MVDLNLFDKVMVVKWKKKYHEIRNLPYWPSPNRNYDTFLTTNKG